MSSVALSDDGLIAAIGTPSSPEGGTRGKAEIYRLEGSLETGRGQQLGQTLEADENGDAFGASLALSANGTVIAVGAPYNNAGQGPISGTDVTLDANVGAAILYKYNETTQEWQPLGRTLTGEHVGDLFGMSVSLNADGSVVAVGASLNNDNGDDSGHVRVFLYNERLMDWVQIGEDIAGTFAFALSGSGVALSAAGDVVVIGSPNNIAVNSDQQGSVQVLCCHRGFGIRVWK